MWDINLALQETMKELILGKGRLSFRLRSYKNDLDYWDLCNLIIKNLGTSRAADVRDGVRTPSEHETNMIIYSCNNVGTEGYILIRAVSNLEEKDIATLNGFQSGSTLGTALQNSWYSGKFNDIREWYIHFLTKVITHLNNGGSLYGLNWFKV